MASGEWEDQIGLVEPAWRAKVAGGVCSTSRRQLGALLLGCFGLHALLRWAVSETAGIDDVDQILRAQIWSWGYGPQPPLYTWLTKIFLSIFGYSVFSLLLLKESLIFSIYALVYGSARLLTRSHLCALAATALLQANPSIAWEAHRELTHTVLVSAFSVATIYTFLRLTPESWSSYLLFGACSGFGMLAKYNFLAVWLALWLGALSVHELRPLLFNRKMLVALLLGAVICAPHFLWLYQHQDLAFSSVQKLKIVAAGDWSGVARGLNKWFLAILAHVGLMLIIIALVLGRGFKRFVVATADQKVLWRTLAWILLLVTANLILFRVSGVQDRYVQPFFFWLPVVLVAALREQISRRCLSILLPLGALAAGVIVLVAPGRALLTEWLEKNEVLNTPFRKLAQDLSSVVDQADCIVAENHTLAGNLRLWFPDKLFLDPEVGSLFSPGPRKGLVVWDRTRNSAPPGELMRFTRSFTLTGGVREIITFEELLTYHHRRTVRLGIALTD